MRRFVGSVEEGLQAETDTKEGSILGEIVFERRNEGADVQIVHGGSKRADTREDEFVGRKNVGWGLGPANVVPEEADGVLEAADVAGAIVEDGD